jgi:sterol desaturase/sphingolipid hydroxylase (fatty acid hydroxylase superfamily)
MTRIFILISLTFILLERILPWRKDQPMIRKNFFSDVAFVLFNGYFFNRLFYASIAATVVVYFSKTMESLGVWDTLNSAVFRGQPLWLQFVALFLIQDFLKWCVHNLLHRIPALWSFHKVHHSVQIMDWMGNMRYHWVEIIVYNGLLFIPLSFLGFQASLFYWIGIIEITIGHFNHSNVKLNIKWLGYFLNSPRMHIWHHAADDPEAINKNFGIVLSVWDWIFGTAYMPANRTPQRLGFDDLETYPSGFILQSIYPLSLLFQKRPRKIAENV